MKVKNIMFDVTNQCNMRCEHCYRDFDSKSSLECDEILRFIDMYNEDEARPGIIISGGESLLYHDIEKLLAKLSGEFNIRLNSNGLILDEFFNSLLKIDKLKIQISLDGYDSKTYKCVRNIDAFEKVLINSVSAKKIGLNVGFRTTLTNYTYENYKKFIEISELTGIPLIIRPVIDTGMEKQEKLLLSYNNIVRWYEDVEKNGYMKYVGANPLIASKCAIFDNNEPVGTLIVANDGSVYPCTVFEHKKYMIGTIKSNRETIDKEFENISKKIVKMFGDTKCTNCNVRKKSGAMNCIASCLLENSKCVNRKIKGE